MLENEPVTLVTHHFLPDSFKVFLTQKRLVSFEITIWYNKLRQKYNWNGTHSFSLKLYQLRRWNWLLSGNTKYLAYVVVKGRLLEGISTLCHVFLRSSFLIFATGHVPPPTDKLHQTISDKSLARLHCVSSYKCPLNLSALNNRKFLIWKNDFLCKFFVERFIELLPSSTMY